MGEWVVPTANAEDNDDVVVALETARVSEESGDSDAAAKWLHRAAAAARHQGRPERAGSLSRTAAQLIRESGDFERKPDEEQVLSDIDDDSSEKTIVETAEQIALKGADSERRRKARSRSNRAQAKVAEKAHSQTKATEKASTRSKVAEKASTQPKTSSKTSAVVVDKPTPIAPLTGQPIAAPHEAIRVAVKMTLGGKFEARPLSGGESPSAGEHEALLVPTQGGSKLS